MSSPKECRGRSSVVYGEVLEGGVEMGVDNSRS